MTSTLGRCLIVVTMWSAAACSGELHGRESPAPAFGSALPTSPSLVHEFDAVGPGSPFRTFGGGTVKETLSGPAIDGVVPEGEALADQSQFASGGSTILTVRIKNVNLPDGTVLPVSLDFTPVGSITLSRREGSLRADLGHFAVSNDEVRVSHGGTVILIGAFFR